MFVADDGATLLPQLFGLEEHKAVRECGFGVDAPWSIACRATWEWSHGVAG